MNNISIKTKIIILLSILITIASGFLIFLMANIINNVTVSALSKQLVETVKSSIYDIEYVDGNLKFNDEFNFNKNGVTLLIYGENKTLLAGQIPAGFDTNLDFENATLKTDVGPNNKYLIIDFFTSFNFTNNYWVRGIIELPDSYQTAKNIITVSLISIPLFLILIAIGTGLILKSSFKPLNEIMNSISSISSTKDLSQRIVTKNNSKEFNELKTTYNNMLERLDNSYTREKRFISDASHELRTPISVIQSSCEYSRQYEESIEEKKETLAIVERQITKMNTLVEQLLSISRLEHGEEALNLKNCDLSSIVRDVCKYYDVKMNLKDNLQVMVDENLISILTRNLIENAIKYGEGKDVIVSTFDENNKIILEVLDYGMGISEEDLNKIWDRFYQVDSSRSNSGSGLGLSIVKIIAQLHNGDLQVKSKPGSGSKFSLYLNKIS